VAQAIKKLMKILVVSQYFWPESFIINQFVKEFVARGHSVSVLTGKPNYPFGSVLEDYKLNPKKYVSYHGAIIYRVPMLSRGFGAFRLILNYLSFAISASLVAPWYLRKLQFDIIFVYEPSPITVGLPAIIISFIKKTPIVFWVQDLWPDTIVALGAIRSRLILFPLNLLVRFIYNRTALVLAQSPSFIKSIEKHCRKSKRIEYFPNWIQFDNICKSSDNVPEIPFVPGIFTILFTGNLGEAQDFPAILDGMATLKSNTAVRLVVVGEGRKSDWLRDQIIQRDLGKNVILLGRYPMERMPSFYRVADALLVTLRKDPVFSLTIPSKLQSYLMAGVPILGMLDGDGAKIIVDANAGLVCPAGDFEGLAFVTRKLIDMPILKRKIMGENGRNYAKKEFGSTILMDRLEAWFMELWSSNVNRTSE
jgi:colanic acid biosynthesis glycosyl transferase WcaI